MTHTDQKIREAVRSGYARIAEGSTTSCCGPSSCCGGNQKDEAAQLAQSIGYDADELANLPDGANMGLSCGNPVALASLSEGEVVLDLGSGGGFDVFITGPKVGASGRVIGVDMTPEMLSKARRNLEAYRERSGLDNVEFRLGEIEHLPVADASFDVVLSNCVVNLSPDKPAVLREAFRVLRPGGRLSISDVVASAPLPEAMRRDEGLVCGCIGGAACIAEMEAWLAEAGFMQVRITPIEQSRQLISQWSPGSGAEDWVVSALIEARKPE